MMPPLLQLEQLNLELGGKVLCRGLDLEIAGNESWALLGRNGAGKTTLLHSILGLHPVQQGQVRVHGTRLADTSRRELSCRVGMLFQEGVDVLPATVMETVMLGRYPHSRSWLSDDQADVEIARAALAELDLESFAERQLDTLSGGERQRLALAMLIAQQPELYLLDEPSNHLDVAFQTRLLGLLQNKLKDQGASMLMATHDINLAARFCDHILLMLNDGEYVAGPADDVLTEHNLSQAYHCRVKSVQGPDMTLYYPA